MAWINVQHPPARSERGQAGLAGGCDAFSRYRRLWVDQGSKAIEMLLRRGPEVSSVCSVSDSQLPDMGGIELLKMVRGMALPILAKFAFLTASIQPGLENLARARAPMLFSRKVPWL